MTTSREHATSSGPALGGLREALLRPSAVGSSHHLVDFSLSSAWLSSLRLNFAGWILRGMLLLIALAAGLTAPGLALLLFVPVCVGWSLAGLELLRNDIIAAGSERSGLIGIVARHLDSSRGVAIPTLSGVLENLGTVGALAMFAGPVALEVTSSWRDIGVVAMAGFVGVAAGQVVTDAGYYNYEPGREPALWMRWFRWLIPPLYAGVGLAAIVAAGGARGWVLATVVGMFVGVAALMLVSDSIQAAATTTHLAVAAERAREFAAELSEEVHRVTTTLDQAAGAAKNDQVARAYRRAFAEIDAVRARANTGNLRKPAPIGDLLGILDRKTPRSERVTASTSAPEIVLAHGGATLLRNAILDLADNARAAGAKEVSVNVDVDPVNTSTVFVTVRVSDDGPGVGPEDQSNDYASGSSRAALAHVCQRRRGFLTYTRTDGHTTATAKFRTDLWKAPSAR